MVGVVGRRADRFVPHPSPCRFSSPCRSDRRSEGVPREEDPATGSRIAPRLVEQKKEGCVRGKSRSRVLAFPRTTTKFHMQYYYNIHKGPEAAGEWISPLGVDSAMLMSAVVPGAYSSRVFRLGKRLIHRTRFILVLPFSYRTCIPTLAKRRHAHIMQKMKHGT